MGAGLGLGELELGTDELEHFPRLERFGCAGDGFRVSVRFHLKGEVVRNARRPMRHWGRTLRRCGSLATPAGRNTGRTPGRSAGRLATHSSPVSTSLVALACG